MTEEFRERERGGKTDGGQGDRGQGQHEPEREPLCQRRHGHEWNVGTQEEDSFTTVGQLVRTDSCVHREEKREGLLGLSEKTAILELTS